MKNDIEYQSETNTTIAQKSTVKDLTVLISDDLTFSKHNTGTVAF